MRSLIQKDHLKHFLIKLSHVQPLWENVGSFRKNHLSSQENLNSERFCFENSEAKAISGTPPRTNLTTVSVFQKIKFFFEKPFCFSRKEKKVRKSWENLSIFTVRILENHTTKTLPVKAILKTMKMFPKNTHVILQWAPKFKLFENSYVKIPVQTHSIESLPKKRSWKIAGISPKKFQLFSQKPICWTFQLFWSNRTLWDAI